MKSIVIFVLSFILFVQSFAQINQQDSLILVNLFNSTSGPNWNTKTNWLTGNVSTWYGIVVQNNRVVEINLKQNRLLGSFPDLTGLTEIKKIDFYNTGISGNVPDFTSNTQLTTILLGSNRITNLPDLSASLIQRLDVSDNHLEFDDLEPNMSIPNFTYSFQSITSDSRFYNVLVSGSVTISKNIPGQFNNYQWKLNSVAIPNQNTNPYELDNINPLQAGSYSLVVTNSLVTGLSISYIVGDVHVVNENLFEWKTNLFPGQEPLARSYGGYWADIDRDGDEDLFINNFTDELFNYLYLNNGDGTFSKVENGAIVNDLIESRSVSWGDLNNDGYPDLFVGAYPEFVEGSMTQSVIYLNNKDLTFSSIVIDQKASAGTWGDVNNDGLLDLAISHEGIKTRIYLNTGNENVEFTGNEFSSFTTWATTFVDFDNDNDLDFFQSVGYTDLPYLNLYRNEGGLVFTEFQGLESLPLWTVNSRGSSWADFDNDGDMDLLVLNAGLNDSYMYSNEGNGQFTKASFASLAGAQLNSSRASTFGDFDNDGDLDLFVIGSFGTSIRKCLLFENINNAYQLLPNSQHLFPGAGPFSHVSSADYNNDGFLDIFVSSQDEWSNNFILKNKGNSNSWLKIRLIGSHSNKLGIGSRVQIKINNEIQSRQILSQSGLSAQNSMIAHFGLGSATMIDEIKIYWPSGSTTIITDQTANVELTVYETPRQEQIITFEELENKTFGDPPFELMASSSSGLPISFESNNVNVISIEGSVATIIGPGYASITASQLGNDIFSPASEEILNISINTIPRQEQIITFNEIPDEILEDSPFQLTASASSGLPISFESSNVNIISIEGSTATIIGTGSVSVTARQLGNDIFLAASDVIRNVSIHYIPKQEQIITFDEIPDKTFGNPTFELMASSSSGLPISFESGNVNVISTEGSIATIMGAGSVSLIARQLGNDFFLPASDVIEYVTVFKKGQVISFDEISDKTFSDSQFQLIGSASSGLPVLFQSNDENILLIDGNIASILAVGLTSITASQLGDDSYLPAADMVRIINISDQVTSLENIELKNYLYPNPVSHSLVVATRLGDDYEISVVNELGVKLFVLAFQASSDNQLIDLSSLKAGAYFLQVKSKAKNLILKIIKT